MYNEGGGWAGRSLAPIFGAGGKSGHRWATRLVTPGGLWDAGVMADATRATDSATENIPPAERSPVTSRRKTCGTSSQRTLRWVRVKRWGKSPPVRSRDRTHGKPRVVQGQIGGEGWPGPLPGEPTLSARRGL